MTPVFLACLVVLLFLPGSSLAADLFTIGGKPVPEVIANVNGTDLSADILRGEIKVFQAMMHQQGRKITPKDTEEFAHEVVGNAIDQELIYQKGKSLKIEIPPATVEREIKDISSQFPSKKMFLSALAFQNLTLELLKTKIEKQLTSEEFIRREIAPQVHVDEKDARGFYDKNKEQFVRPLRVEASHIFVSAPDRKREGRARDLKDQKKADRLMKLIEAEAREKIDGLLKRVRAGEDFATLAREYSEDKESKDQGGFLGTVTRTNTLPEIFGALVRLKKGETSGVVQSPFGFHILKVNKIIPSQPLEFTEVKSDILNLLLKKAVEEKKKAYLERLRKNSDIKIFL